MAITSETVASTHRADDIAYVRLHGLEPMHLLLMALADDERSTVQALLAAF